MSGKQDTRAEAAGSDSVVLAHERDVPGVPTVRLSWTAIGEEPPPWIDVTWPDGRRVRYERQAGCCIAERCVHCGEPLNRCECER